jgi:hypothetical protein
MSTLAAADAPRPPGRTATPPGTTATVVGVNMAATQSVARRLPVSLFPHLGPPAAFPQASDSLGSVANRPARLPRGERNGTRA